MRLIVTIVKIGQHLLPRANFLFSTLGHRRIDSSVHFLSFLPLAFLVTNVPSSSRYIFRVALSLHVVRTLVIPIVSNVVCARVCRWTINRSRSIAFAYSGKIGIPSGNTMHKEAYRFEGKTGCAAARYRLYAIVPRFYPSGKPWNGREVADRCVRSVDYPIPPLLRICDN